jgi:hypothetical protein
LVRAYPWIKYRILSNMTGKLHGWFEGRVESMHLTGGFEELCWRAGCLTTRPLDGSLDYQFRWPARVANADLQLYSTNIKVMG